VRVNLGAKPWSAPSRGRGAAAGSRFVELTARGACLACEAVVSRETSSHPALHGAVLYCLAIETGGRRRLRRSARDPVPRHSHYTTSIY
jgi:hypothetical protein